MQSYNPTYLYISHRNISNNQLIGMHMVSYISNSLIQLDPKLSRSLNHTACPVHITVKWYVIMHSLSSGNESDAHIQTYKWSSLCAFHLVRPDYKCRYTPAQWFTLSLRPVIVCEQHHQRHTHKTLMSHCNHITLRIYTSVTEILVTTSWLECIWSVTFPTVSFNWIQSCHIH